MKHNEVISGQQDEYCAGCVYFPPNLPVNAYTYDDYRMLQKKNCSFDYIPMDKDCEAARKTSCSLLDLSRKKTP